MLEKIVYQIGEGGEIVKTWESVKQIAFLLKLNRQTFNQALRDGCRANGYWWIYKHQWDKGERIKMKNQIRNVPLLAYKDGNFLGEFKNSVEASKKLKLSASNIRLVANPKHPKKDLKGYIFKHKPQK